MASADGVLVPGGAMAGWRAEVFLAGQAVGAAAQCSVEVELRPGRPRRWLGYGLGVGEA